MNANRDLEARTEWARKLEACEAKESSDQLARCVELLNQAEATVVERTEWALDLQRQLTGPSRCDGDLQTGSN